MRVRGVEYSARAVLKAFWLTVAEAPFVALLLEEVGRRFGRVADALVGS
jgi:hypothetical protein